MQNVWQIELNADYHRQQLLSEAAQERLAALAARGQQARTRANGAVTNPIAALVAFTISRVKHAIPSIPAASGNA